jgi:hypothetical protein
MSTFRHPLGGAGYDHREGPIPAQADAERVFLWAPPVTSAATFWTPYRAFRASIGAWASTLTAVRMATVSQTRSGSGSARIPVEKTVGRPLSDDSMSSTSLRPIRSSVLVGSSRSSSSVP